MYLSSLIQQLFLTINYIFPQRNNNLINKIGFNNLQNVFIKKPYSIINTILFRLYKEYRLSQCLQSLYVLNRINVLKINIENIRWKISLMNVRKHYLNLKEKNPM